MNLNKAVIYEINVSFSSFIHYGSYESKTVEFKKNGAIIHVMQPPWDVHCEDTFSSLYTTYLKNE